MKHVFVLAIFASLLAACAGSLGSLSGISGDRDQVTVSGRDAANALAFAVLHCSRYGRSARYLRRMGQALTYDCVSQDGRS